MQITIQVTGDKQVMNKMKRLGTSLYQLRRAMNQIGEEGARYFSNQGFNSQGGAFGASWTPLSRKYALRKAKEYPGRPPLVATGKMQKGFNYQASESQVLIGNKTSHFRYHQSTAPRSKIPRRQTMGINDPIKKMVRIAIEKEVREKIRSA